MEAYSIGGNAENVVTRRNGIPTHLKRVLSQTQAAAIAVLAANVRESMDETVAMTNQLTPTAESRATYDWLKELESLAIESINENDGEVVRHIGTAAKQMNPLLH